MTRSTRGLSATAELVGIVEIGYIGVNW